MTIIYEKETQLINNRQYLLAPGNFTNNFSSVADPLRNSVGGGGLVPKARKNF